MQSDPSIYDDGSQPQQSQSQSVFSQRFGAITKQLPSAFKKSKSKSKNTLAFEVIINENRALKNEIEVYKRSIDALTLEKENLESHYDELKVRVSDMTTQLRIMTRRYNKIKNKNEEYKKHFQNTLTIRLSAQQETIRNYHTQLTQIKQKYDILYQEYLEKNSVIKEYELNMTYKQLKLKLHQKDESLHFLSQIISEMYHNSLPIIQSQQSQRGREESLSSESSSSPSPSSSSPSSESKEDNGSSSESEEDNISPIDAPIAIANPNKLSVADSNKLNVRSLSGISGISVDDDGIDKRDDDELQMKTIPKTMKKKKRRRSWVMEGGNGPIVITTIGGKHSVVGNSDHKNKHKHQNQNQKAVNHKSPSKSSASESMDVAPSPAPPPPHQIMSKTMMSNLN